jgi:SAM-dependent methyltransferase
MTNTPLIHFFRKVSKTLLSYGFNARVFLNTPRRNNNNKWYYSDFEELKRQKGNDTTFRIATPYPILSDKFAQGGVMSGHYFHQDLYVARLINLANPDKHLDIGSRTDGFVAHVASFREIELIDIRDIDSNVKNILTRKADLMKLPSDLVNYCDSISSLHAIEHFGLGRYNDPIDYWGHLKAIKNITAILKKGGCFYFSAPIGPQRIEFNAHRIFSVEYLISVFSADYTIKSFSYVNDLGIFYEDAELTLENIQSNFGCKYGCGIFTLIKT